MILYTIKNNTNGKIYVGVTTRDSIEKRWSEHLRDSKNRSSTPICKAIKKYGKESFQFTIVCSEINSPQELIYAEKYLIRYYNSDSSNSGYNCSSGGEGVERAYKMKLVFKKHKKERVYGVEFRSRMSQIAKNNWANNVYGSAEYIEKQRLSKIGKDNLKKRKAVICNETGQVFDSLKSAAKFFTGNDNKSPNLIIHLKGKTNSAWGHTFSYFR